MGASLRIVHLASLARCGETLVQRALSAHPAVHVVFDLHEPNTAAQMRLFQLLRVWPGDTLPRAQLERLLPGEVAPQCEVLLIKQGIFAVRHAAAGFGLLRNPYASFCSLWHYDAKLAGRKADAATNLHHWRHIRQQRLLVWADAMLPALLPALRAERDPVRQFLAFWQARVAQVLAQQRTIVHYEDFVQSPEPELRRICAAAGLDWTPALLQAHRLYRPGQVGHGGIDLGAPIRPAPAWTPDPQVPVAPFAEAVARSPLRRYDGLYAQQREEAHAPC